LGCVKRPDIGRTAVVFELKCIQLHVQANSARLSRADDDGIRGGVEYSLDRRKVPVPTQHLAFEVGTGFLEGLLGRRQVLRRLLVIGVRLLQLLHPGTAGIDQSRANDDAEASGNNEHKNQNLADNMHRVVP
jgi:hypothetical protein